MSRNEIEPLLTTACPDCDHPEIHLGKMRQNYADLAASEKVGFNLILLGAAAGDRSPLPVFFPGPLALSAHPWVLLHSSGTNCTIQLP